MPKIKKEALFSPLGIFFVYILVSGIAVMAFRLVFPGEAAPLPNLSRPWRLVRGLLDYLYLFPALGLSALVIPFGFKVYPREELSPFSPQFLNSLKFSIFGAIAGAAIYSILFFVVSPLARDYEANLLFKGRLYGLSKEQAGLCYDAGEWDEAEMFVAVCENIWPESPDLSKLKLAVEMRGGKPAVPETSSAEGGEAASGLTEPKKLELIETLALAETALAEERYFDAHWLASLADRLAEPGSVEEAVSVRLAAAAWNGVNLLEPNAAEREAYRVYALKKEGHEALLAGEWIRAYYIFLELLELDADDPDAERYFALSKEGLKNAAFFIDEMGMAFEKILTGALFSVPYESGRLVMRVSSLSVSTDSAYAIGAEILAFDGEGLPLWSVEAPYAKLLPLSLDTNSEVALLMRALDKTDKTKIREPSAQGFGQSPPEDAHITLPVAWDNFLLLSKIRAGLGALSLAELETAAEQLGNYGYQRQVFEAELIRRFSEPLFLLPLGIFAVIVGWVYRAVKRPRYMAVPMLFLLPLVFNGVMQLCRNILSGLGTWAVISFGLGTAAVFFGAAILLLFIIALILLAAQHG